MQWVDSGPCCSVSTVLSKQMPTVKMFYSFHQAVMIHVQNAVGRASRSVCHVQIQQPCSKMGNVFLTAALVSTVRMASAMVK